MAVSNLIITQYTNIQPVDEQVKTLLDRCEKLPEKVRHRITNSHMEIETLCDYLRSLDLSKCREIHLLHLSDAMSDEGGFMRKVLRSIPKGIEVKSCEK